MSTAEDKEIKSLEKDPESVDVKGDYKQKKMEEMQMRVKKLREERAAKHAARIEMLKKMNIEKYSDKSILAMNLSLNTHHPKHSTIPKTSTINNTVHKPVPTNNNKTNGQLVKIDAVKSPKVNSKYNNIQTKIDCRRSIAPKLVPNHSVDAIKKPTSNRAKTTNSHLVKPKGFLNGSLTLKHNGINFDKDEPKTAYSMTNFDVKNKGINRSNLDVIKKNSLANNDKLSATFNRLSKPKAIVTEAYKQEKKEPFNVVQKKVQLKNCNVKLGQNQNKTVKIQTLKTNNSKDEKADFKEKSHMRRSLSTVHFKRMGPDAAKKCMRRTFSVGNFKHSEIEDELSTVLPFKEYVMPVPSEKKKSVKFLTPLRKSNTPTLFLSTPKPSELKSRLNNWLQKRGKSLSSYHHLHCFGVHKKDVEQNSGQEDDENKENIEAFKDDSFEELTTAKVNDNAAEWRRASYTLDSPVVLNVQPGKKEPMDVSKPIQTTSVGALEDLHQLISEGYSWQQCAEWLDAIVRHSPDLTKTASYWECRAALEDKRGDFPRAVECYNKAILQGVKPAEVEESLDHLLQKFMKLNLDSGKATQADPKFLDVKNVFKSTLIRFAIQQKNIVESKQTSGNLINKYVATPVRRSSRLSLKPESAKVTDKKQQSKIRATPNGKGKDLSPKLMSASKSTGRKHLVQLCSTLQNVDGEIRNNLVFVPNKALNFNDL